jgi:hypothetical protein
MEKVVKNKLNVHFISLNVVGSTVVVEVKPKLVNKPLP